MLSRSLRDRLSDLIRQGAGAAGAAAARAAANSGSPEHAPGRVVTSGADAPQLAPEQVVNGVTSGSGPPERCLVHTGIEELLPGGVISGPHGSLFIHERLYTDLGEQPEPVLERFDALCRLAPGAPLPGCDESAGKKRGSGKCRNGQSSGEHLGNGHSPGGITFGYAQGNGHVDGYDDSLEPRIVYEPTGPIQPFLPTMEAQVEWPERGLFRRFGYRRMLFLDLETCGLSGCPVFLAGVALIGDGDVVLRQLFARDYAEERALLAELARLMEEADFLVTFNGKTFDVPFLRDRAVHHRMRLPFSRPHLDLVWMVRRRWKRQLPDCKLKTLEWRVLRRRRAGDVWGYEIPGLYHDYVQNGQPHRLIPVFHHNMLDVVAMVELLPAVFDPETTVY